MDRNIKGAVIQTEALSRENKDVVFSVGGSVLFENRDPSWKLRQVLNIIFQNEDISIDFSEQVVHGVIGMCNEILESGDRNVFIVTGGGKVARMAMDDARKYGDNPDKNDVSQRQLDFIGSDISGSNASRLKAAFEAACIPVFWNSEEKWGKWGEEPKGRVYVRGGTRPGHTTDMVAVDIAVAEKAPVVINIGNTPGLYPKKDNKNGYDQNSPIIEEMNISDFLRVFHGERNAGDNFIFEREAAQKALENGITIVLVGSSFENITNMFSEKDFVGTVLHPR